MPTQLPRATIHSVAGFPTLHINGQPVPPFAYMAYLGEEKYYREVAAAGIHLYCFPAYLGDRGINTRSGIGPFRTGIWRGETEFDFSDPVIDFEKILHADPDASIIIRLHLDPPGWWEKAHPEACCQLPDGRTLRQCFAAETWRKPTGEALKIVIDWLLQSRFAEHLLGLHLAAGFTEEWLYHYFDGFYDLNPARREAFRQWLTEKYEHNPAQLRHAWQNATLTFETAEPADISGAQPGAAWRNLRTDQPVLDTLRFHSAMMAQSIRYFCELTKTASQRRLLTGAFYGYHYFLTDARRGQGAMHALLDCPDVDFFSSPNAYLRQAGEDWPPMSAIQSIQAHGKLWLAENDTRTSLTTLLKERAPQICPPGQYESAVWRGPATLEISEALLQKNAARMLAQGYGGWWFDMWGGWFSHPRLLAVLEATPRLWQNYLGQSKSPMKVEVAVFLDEELPFYDSTFGQLTEKILSNRYSLGKTGADYDLWYRSDWKRADKTNYRLIWLLGWPELAESDLAEISRLGQAGVFVFWTNLSGSRFLAPAVVENWEFPEKYHWWGAELGAFITQAGAHRYTENEDVVYARNGWLCLHTATGGQRRVKLPFHARIIDPLTQQILFTGTYFDLTLPENSTRIFRVEPVA